MRVITDKREILEEKEVIIMQVEPLKCSKIEEAILHLMRMETLFLQQMKMCIELVIQFRVYFDRSTYFR